MWFGFIKYYTRYYSYRYFTHVLRGPLAWIVPVSSFKEEGGVVDFQWQSRDGWDSEWTRWSKGTRNRVEMLRQMNHHVSFPSSGFREYVGSAWRGTTERDRTDGMAGRQTEKAKFDKERTMDELIGKLGSESGRCFEASHVVAHFSIPQLPKI